MSKTKRRNVFTIVVLILLFSGLILSCNSFLYARRHFEINRTYKHARDDLRNGNVIDALTKFVKATEISFEGSVRSLIAQPYIEMAATLSAQGKPQDALGYCLKSVHILGRFDDEGYGYEATMSDYCSTIEYQIQHPEDFIIPDYQNELKNNYKTWQSQGIKNYRYNLEVDCFCGISTRDQPITIEVRNDEIYSVTDINGVPLDTIDDGTDTKVDTSLTTIDNIFAYAQSIVADGNSINGTYDANLGFPTWMCLRNCYTKEPIADAFFSIKITNFEKLP